MMKPPILLSIPIIEGFTDFRFTAGALVCFRHEPRRPFTVRAQLLKKGETGTFFPVYDIGDDTADEPYVWERLLDAYNDGALVLIKKA